MTTNKCGAQQACYHVDLCASIIAQLMRKMDKINGFLKLTLYSTISNEYIGYVFVELDMLALNAEKTVFVMETCLLFSQIHAGSSNESLRC